MPPTISHRKIMSSTDYFSYFFPLPLHQASLAFPLQEGGNENSNKISNPSVQTLICYCQCHNSDSWVEGLKSKQLLEPYILLYKNLITQKFFSCMELLRGRLKYNFLMAILAKRSQTTFFEEKMLFRSLLLAVINKQRKSKTKIY